MKRDQIVTIDGADEVIWMMRFLSETKLENGNYLCWVQIETTGMFSYYMENSPIDSEVESVELVNLSDG